LKMLGHGQPGAQCKQQWQWLPAVTSTGSYSIDGSYLKLPPALVSALKMNHAFCNENRRKLPSFFVFVVIMVPRTINCPRHGKAFRRLALPTVCITVYFSWFCKWNRNPITL
jgi:hypothetical protein